MNRPTTDFRKGPDRRRQPRGGRREDDIDGFAPLVLLVGEERSVVEKAETILAKLRFAVSTNSDAVDALRILPDLRPNLILVEPRHEALIRAAAQVPVVVMRESHDSLIDDIRRALRVTPIR